DPGVVVRGGVVQGERRAAVEGDPGRGQDAAVRPAQGEGGPVGGQGGRAAVGVGGGEGEPAVAGDPGEGQVVRARDDAVDGRRVGVEVHVVGGPGQARGAVVDPAVRGPVGAAEAGGGVPEGAVAGVVAGPVVIASPGHRRDGDEDGEQGGDTQTGEGDRVAA